MGLVETPAPAAMRPPLGASPLSSAYTGEDELEDASDSEASADLRPVLEQMLGLSRVMRESLASQRDAFRRDIAVLEERNERLEELVKELRQRQEVQRDELRAVMTKSASEPPAPVVVSRGQPWWALALAMAVPVAMLFVKDRLEEVETFAT